MLAGPEVHAEKSQPPEQWACSSPGMASAGKAAGGGARASFFLCLFILKCEALSCPQDSPCTFLPAPGGLLTGEEGSPRAACPWPPW